MADVRTPRFGHARGGHLGLVVLVLVTGAPASAGQIENQTGQLEHAMGPLVSTAQTRRGDAPTSIAVLAFENITGDPADHWMGAGIAETVSAVLEGSGLAILGQEALSVSDAAPSLVVSGAYQRLEDRLRITAWITGQNPEHALQSVIVDGALVEFFTLQDQLATWIRQELIVRGARGTAGCAARRTGGRAGCGMPQLSEELLRQTAERCEAIPDRCRRR